MGTEGVGRKLLLTPSGNPTKIPEKQTVTASHKVLTLQALSSSFNAGTAKRGCLLRDFWQSVPPKRPCPLARYRLLQDAPRIIPAAKTRLTAAPDRQWYICYKLYKNSHSSEPSCRSEIFVEDGRAQNSKLRSNLNLMCGTLALKKKHIIEHLASSGTRRTPSLDLALRSLWGFAVGVLKWKWTSSLKRLRIRQGCRRKSPNRKSQSWAHRGALRADARHFKAACQAEKPHTWCMKVLFEKRSPSTLRDLL